MLYHVNKTTQLNTALWLVRDTLELDSITIEH